MPRRRKRERQEKEAAKRPLRDMVRCAMCGAVAEPVSTSGADTCAMCAHGHLTQIDGTGDNDHHTKRSSEH
jgi:hypothetical protein